MEELDKTQVGAADTTGAMLQPRLTVPLKDPVGASARLDLALGDRDHLSTLAMVARSVN